VLEQRLEQRGLQAVGKLEAQRELHAAAAGADSIPERALDQLISTCPGG
jgi:hypothetical protein